MSSTLTPPYFHKDDSYRAALATAENASMSNQFLFPNIIW